MTRRRLAVSPPAVLGALVLCAIAVWALAAPGGRGMRLIADAAPRLADDDGQAPMFTLPAMGPDETARRCIRLRFRGERGEIRLASDVKGGALGRRLALTVERGSGGEFDDCRGFRGEVVYDGTLAGLDGARDERPWVAGGDEQRTYRFTVRTPADFEGDASATFAWQVHDTGKDAEKPGGAPGGSPSARADAAPAGGAAAREPGAATRKVANPAGAGRDGGREKPAKGAAGRDRAAAGGGGGARKRADAPGAAPTPAGAAPAPRRRGGVAEAVGRALEASKQVLGAGAPRAAFPGILLGLLALFFAGQHRIDRSDPKLALAPLHREDDLFFDPPLPHAPGGIAS